MKQVVLAILLTGVAGFIGLMGGSLITAMIGTAFYSPATPAGASTSTIPWLAGTVMVIMPILGAAVGMIIGWVVILKMKSTEYESRHCGNCDYNLNKLASDQCPECGADIPTWQQRLLKNSEPDHA